MNTTKQFCVLGVSDLVPLTHILKTVLRRKELTLSSVEKTLKERGARYGSFEDQAYFAEELNKVLSSSPNWKKMKPDSKEALRIIVNKIGRILNGDPEYDDNWRDIAGYATLVLNRINNEAN